MSTAEKKEALKQFIEEADEKLTGLLFTLANEYNDPDQHYTQEELVEKKDTL